MHAATEVIVHGVSKDPRRKTVAPLWMGIGADDVAGEWERLLADHVAGAVGLTADARVGLVGVVGFEPTTLIPQRSGSGR
jgi:hypothetical protein